MTPEQLKALAAEISGSAYADAAKVGNDEEIARLLNAPGAGTVQLATITRGQLVLGITPAAIALGGASVTHFDVGESRQVSLQ